MRLAGRVALITGASRGIGAKIATTFAADGAKLVLGARDEQRLESVADACRALGSETITIAGDLTEAPTASKWAGVALDQFERIDVLVNNAAMASEQLLLVLSDDELERVIALNVLSLTRMARAVLKPMLRQRAGTIINMSSVAAARPGRGQAVYAGTKGYVESFTRALAVEVGRKGISVNAVAPGVVETQMTANVLGAAKREIEERIALRRTGSTSDIASAVAYLASPDASYINGAVLAVDGGFSGGM